MIYSGIEIKDISVVREEEPYKLLGSNDFDMTDEDLEQMLEDYHTKEEDLKRRGIEFSGLHYNFYANEYEDSDYYHSEAECEVKFEYWRPETDEEAQKRIKEEKKRIDQMIEDKEREKAYKKADELREINKAKKLLEKNGYKITM